MRQTDDALLSKLTDGDGGLLIAIGALHAVVELAYEDQCAQFEFLVMEKLGLNDPEPEATAQGELPF